jgi:hypothetical protein
VKYLSNAKCHSRTNVLRSSLAMRASLTEANIKTKRIKLFSVIINFAQQNPALIFRVWQPRKQFLCLWRSLNHLQPATDLVRLFYLVILTLRVNCTRHWPSVRHEISGRFRDLQVGGKKGKYFNFSHKFTLTFHYLSPQRDAC